MTATDCFSSAHEFQMTESLKRKQNKQKKKTCHDDYRRLCLHASSLRYFYTIQRWFSETFIPVASHWPLNVNDLRQTMIVINHPRHVWCLRLYICSLPQASSGGKVSRLWIEQPSRTDPTDKLSHQIFRVFHRFGPTNHEEQINSGCAAQNALNLLFL